jgi:hypothetical protein
LNTENNLNLHGMQQLYKIFKILQHVAVVFLL